MADGLGQFRQFLVGIRSFQSLEVRLRQRSGRWAAVGIGLRVMSYSHSTINDITQYPARQAFTMNSSQTITWPPRLGKLRRLLVPSHVQLPGSGQQGSRREPAGRACPAPTVSFVGARHASPGFAYNGKERGKLGC